MAPGFATSVACEPGVRNDGQDEPRIRGILGRGASLPRCPTRTWTRDTLADALWLARLLPHVPRRSVSPGTPPTEPGDDLPGSRTRRAPLLPARSTVSPSPTVSPASGDAESSGSEGAGTPEGWVDVYASGGETASSPPQGGWLVRVRSADPLPEVLLIGRCLRPFMRRMASRFERVLDEEQSVLQMADERLLQAVLRPAWERRYVLHLVVERTASMVVWRVP